VCMCACALTHSLLLCAHLILILRVDSELLSYTGGANRRSCVIIPEKLIRSATRLSRLEHFDVRAVRCLRACVRACVRKRMLSVSTAKADTYALRMCSISPLHLLPARHATELCWRT